MAQNAKASLLARGILERSVNAADRRHRKIGASKAELDFMQTKATGIIAQPLVLALTKAAPSERKDILKGLGTLRQVLGLAEDRTRDATASPGSRIEKRRARQSKVGRLR